ncbi:hypothetical protein [Chryseobacterium sp. RU37D]|uniref:hypothetical protein n=1 Tax=Chryseobacterium sp. RU37D TaxID=1907397 RepID=UPI0015C2D623|nr:hypothetical protein [Chryseobacterium sp. RU37D]
MSYHFKGYHVMLTHSPMNSALCISMVISNREIDETFLQQSYQMKLLQTLILNL